MQKTFFKLQGTTSEFPEALPGGPEPVWEDLTDWQEGRVSMEFSEKTAKYKHFRTIGMVQSIDVAAGGGDVEAGNLAGGDKGGKEPG